MESNILITPSISVTQNWPASFAEADILDFEAERSYKTFDSYLKYYKNMWVSPDSVLYKNGLLMKGSLPAKQYEKYYRFRYILKKILKSKKLTLQKEKKYLLATDLWSTGHFHWIADILPKLLSIADKCKEYTLLLQDTPYIRSIAIHTIQKMKLPFQDILFMNENCLYKVQNLHFLTKLGASGHCHPGLIKSVRDLMRSDVESSGKRIYVSRSKAQYRRVLNEENLIALLKKHSFEIINAEDLDIEEQASIFSSAQVLISIHGAGLTNCIFMKPESKVVEIRRYENGPTNVGYWHLAESLGQQYYYYNGTPDSDQTIVGRGCNITVDLDDFEQKILKKIV
jgi:hypothetical protein